VLTKHVKMVQYFTNLLGIKTRLWELNKIPKGQYSTIFLIPSFCQQQTRKNQNDFP